MLKKQKQFCKNICGRRKKVEASVCWQCIVESSITCCSGIIGIVAFCFSEVKQVKHFASVH